MRRGGQEASAHELVAGNIKTGSAASTEISLILATVESAGDARTRVAPESQPKRRLPKSDPACKRVRISLTPCLQLV